MRVEAKAVGGGGVEAQFIRLFAPALIGALLAGCAATPAPQEKTGAAAEPGSPETIEIARFSRRRVNEGLPEHWEPFRIPFKSPTAYRFVDIGGVVGLEARADKSASGLRRRVKIDPRRHAFLEWRWRVERSMPQADKRVASREDSPARVLIAFDGDRARLDVHERAMMNLADALSAGQKMPYAMLMYVHSNKYAPDTLLPNPRTTRVQMIVVEQGDDGVGKWNSFRRNVRADFLRAFGEEPGEIVSVGMMTDADNTQSSARAVYGDISFVPGP